MPIYVHPTLNLLLSTVDVRSLMYTDSSKLLRLRAAAAPRVRESVKASNSNSGSNSIAGAPPEVEVVAATAS